MRINEDSEINIIDTDTSGNEIVLGPWRRDFMQAFGEQGFFQESKDRDILADKIEFLLATLGRTFPIDVQPEWQPEIHVPSSLIRIDVCNGPPFGEFSKTTSNCHWVVLSAGTIKLLHQIMKDLWSMPAAQASLGLDKMEPTQTELLAEVCFWTSVEFLVLHEISHIIKGHTLLERESSVSPSMKKQYRPIEEHEADLFAAENLAWIFVNEQTFLRGLPRVKGKFDSSVFRIVGMLAALIYFTGAAIYDRHAGSLYPPFDQRLYSLIDFVSSSVNEIDGKKLSYFEMLDAREGALKILLPFLNTYPPATKLKKAGIIATLERLCDDVGGETGTRLMNQCREYDLRMFDSQDKYKSYRLRRKRHNPWDANW